MYYNRNGQINKSTVIGTPPKNDDNWFQQENHSSKWSVAKEITISGKKCFTSYAGQSKIQSSPYSSTYLKRHMVKERVQ